MIAQRKPLVVARHLSVLAVTLAGILLVVTGAQAGQCPAGKTVASGAGQTAGVTMPKNVADTVIGMIKLADEPGVGVADRLFRLRKLVIGPGGEVPWHSHEDRPAIIYIVQGEVTEYASTCAVPIVHKAGDVAPETHATTHWWRNTGRKTAVLLSADLLHETAEDPHVM
ncbi:cupin domain-containing protein [Benzoatithermus flavus]|uniref:Cupin domain-containing protein n=1 Tax=Benzoatithermus flavus TaxID=3108223 RepID=A0ABU8XPA8_9PROT